MKKFLTACLCIFLQQANWTNAQSFNCAAFSSNSASSTEGMQDRAHSLVRDNQGNFITIGTTHPTGTTLTDYFISKSTVNCAVSWVASYDGTAHTGDIPEDVATDASNNVYVTGRSNGLNSSSDMTTLKLNSSGVIQWVDRFNISNAFDDGTALTTTYLTNQVVIAGWSLGVHGIVVRKLNTTTGAMVWFHTWTPTAPDAQEARAYGVTTDPSGNIYVCGESFYLSSGIKNSKALLLKYDASGNLLWVNEYQPPVVPCINMIGNFYHKVKVDFSGSVYGCGGTTPACNNQDLLLNKFDAGGNLAWTATYDRAQYTDVAYDMVVGVDNKIDLTGFSCNNTGTPDLGVYQVNTNGTISWTSFYNGTMNPSYDEGRSIMVDGCTEAIYVGGIVQQGPSASNYDYIVLDYSPSGSQQWASTYGQASNKADIANSIALGSGPSLVIAGYSADASNNASLATVKFNLPNLPCIREAAPAESLTPATVSIYPNPSSGIFTIENISEDNSVERIEVMDLPGNVIYVSGNLNPGESGVISLSQFSKGYYFCNVYTSDGRRQTFKLVII